MWKQTLRRLNYAEVPRIVHSMWGGDPGSVRLVNEGINLVFRFEDREGGAYLRLTHSALNKRIKVESATDYLRRLHTEGAQVNEPLASVNGRLVEDILDNGELFYANAVREVKGSRFTTDEKDSAAFKAWGRALGTLHRAAETYSAPERSWFLDWEAILVEIEGLLPTGDELLRGEFDQVSAWLRTLPADRDFGLTHADFRPGNVIWDGRVATIIDFDEPVWQWLFVDVARAMLEYEDRPLEERRGLLATFLEGYREVRPIDPAWEPLIDWFLRYRVLCMLVWSLGDEPSGGSGSWIGDFRRRIECPPLWYP